MCNQRHNDVLSRPVSTPRSSGVDESRSQHESNSTEHAAHESKAPEPSDVPAAKSSTENSRRPSAGTIAGAVVGSVAGAVLLALLAFFLARRRRPPTSPVNPQKPPSLAPDFEPIEEVQVVVPYGTASRPSMHNARPSETFDLLSSNVSESASQPVSTEKATADQSPAQDAQGGAFAGPSGSANRNSDTPTQRADDMDGDLLPPEYRPAWGRRPSASLEDAAAVARLEKPGIRAHDGASP